MVPIIGNLIYGKEKAERRIVEKSGDLVALILVESRDHQKLVELSLKSGKSYIGFALRSEIKQQGESDVALIPIASGYRDKDTQMLKITINYAPIILKSLNEKSDLSDEDFRIVIPMSEIISARIFYPRIYERFQKDLPQSPEQTS